MWNIIIGFGLIIIGMAIGFTIAAMLMQSKIADEFAMASHLMYEKCKECKKKEE